MSVPMRGEYTATVEAGEFTLAYNLGACAAIEGQFEGRGLQSILKDIEGDDPKISTFLIVIWAGLKKHHGLTLDEVGELVEMHEAPLWGEAIGKAMGGGAMKSKDDARPRKAAKAR